MRKYFVIFLLAKSLFSGDYGLVELEKERAGLIATYSKKIDEALEKNLLDRAVLLKATLSCFKNAKCKRDITVCKIEERRKIMNIIRGVN